MERYVLYGGRVNIDYDPGAHVYYFEDTVVNGITDALKIIHKPWYVAWALKLAGDHVIKNLTPGKALDELEIKNLVEDMKRLYKTGGGQAADIGTMTHDWIERYYRGENPPEPINEQLRNTTRAFLKFADEHQIEIVESERLIYSVQNRFAGRVDMICKIDGKLAIIDWKTSKTISPENFLQLGGYDIGYSEEQLFNVSSVEDFKPVELHIIVQCSKLGEMNMAISDKVSRNRQGFMHALGLTRTLKSIEEDLKAEKKTAKENKKNVPFTES